MTSTSTPERLQRNLRRIHELLEKQRVVEQLVTRQRAPRKELAESLVHRQHLVELQIHLSRLHSADLAHLLETVALDQRLMLWKQIDSQRGGEVLLNMRDEAREGLIQALPHSELEDVLQQLSADDLTVIADDVPDQVLQQRLKELTADDRHWFQTAVSYPEDTVGHLMTHEMATALEEATQTETVVAMRRLKPFPAHTDKLFVIDQRGRFKGIVTMQALLLAEPGMRVRDIMVTRVVSFQAEDPARDAASAFDRYELVSAPVLSDRGSLIGRLTVDRVVDYRRESTTDDVLSIAGLSGREDPYGSVWQSARNRWLWLFINLATAFFASRVIGAFEGVIAELVALAALMPIVASIGGNTGNQTAALVIRSLAQGPLTRTTFKQFIRKELGISLINGAVFGVVVGLFALVFYRQPALAGVIATAVLFNLVIAAVVGLLAPTTLERYGRDPALGSSIILTATTDIMGFMVFLSLAGAFLVRGGG